nr:hypothetical protein [Tanacetum cinerariifolium]
MLTQQDIYAAGFESRSPMLNKENYVPWSSRLLRYAKSRPNGKLIHNSIINGPYVRRMIPEPEADDQAIQTILLGLPEDIYAAVDSYETAQEIWLRVQQMMKGSNIGIQEKKAKLFNEWERFTSNEGELIESYYHRFLKLMNDLKRNKHFPEKITSNLKFLNNLQPEWSRHVTIVHQTKDLHTADYTKLYDFLKYNQKDDVAQGNGNQNLNGNGNLVAARAEGNADVNNGNQISKHRPRVLRLTKLPSMIQMDQLRKWLWVIKILFYLKQAQKKQQSLYDGKVLLEKHDPPVVHDSEETLQLAQESRQKMKQLNKEIKPANYTKINHLSGVFVSQSAKSREELYFLNDSKTANVSKSISIPNEEFSDDTTPSVARKFLNEEAAKFVGDFKSLAKEADKSLAKQKALEIEIERLLRAVVSQDTMSVV